MPILRRITDIVSANINEAIDRCEDPALMLQQAVREMEEAYRAAQDRAVAVLAAEKLLRRRLEETRGEAAEWSSRAEQAVQRDDDGSARRSLARKRECDRLAAALENQLLSSEQLSASLRAELNVMRSRTVEMRQRLSLLAARRRCAEARIRMLDALPTRSATEVSSRFDRWTEALELEEARAEAWGEIHTPFAAEDENREAQSQLDADLQALKQKLGR